VGGGSGADSMLRFWIERRGDEMKHCRKMKRRHRACLNSMGRKHDTTYGVISRRRGGTGEGNGEDNISWANVNLTGPKNKENSHGQFSYYK
jgi:hypothetical protein